MPPMQSIVRTSWELMASLRETMPGFQKDLNKPPNQDQQTNFPRVREEVSCRLMKR
jgi:predicted phage tail protein